MKTRVRKKVVVKATLDLRGGCMQAIPMMNVGS